MYLYIHNCWVTAESLWLLVFIIQRLIADLLSASVWNHFFVFPKWVNISPKSAVSEWELYASSESLLDMETVTKGVWLSERWIPTSQALFVKLYTVILTLAVLSAEVCSHIQVWQNCSALWWLWCRTQKGQKVEYGTTDTSHRWQLSPSCPHSWRCRYRFWWNRQSAVVCKFVMAVLYGGTYW